MRRSIAADLELILEQDERRRRSPGPISDGSRETRRTWRSDIETVVERLKAPTAVSPEGVARALLLTTDCSSPLYGADSAQELEAEARAAFRAIDQGRHLDD